MICDDARAPEPASDWERTARVVQPTLATLFFLSSLRLIEAQMAVRIFGRLGLLPAILIGLALCATPLLAILLRRHCTHPAVISALPLAMGLARAVGQLWNRPDVNWICAGLTIMLYGLFLPLYAGWLGSRESRGIYALAWSFVAAFLLDICLRALFASADPFFDRGPAALIVVLLLALALSSRTITWPRRSVREEIAPLGRGGWVDGLMVAGLGTTFFLGYALYLNASLAGPLANATYPSAVLTCVGVAALVATVIYYDADAVQWIDRQPLVTAIIANVLVIVATAALLYIRPSHLNLPLMALGLAGLMVNLVLFGRLLASTAGHPTIVLGAGLLLGGVALVGLSAPMQFSQTEWPLLAGAGLTLIAAVAAGAALRSRRCPARAVRAASWVWGAAIVLVVAVIGALLVELPATVPEPQYDIRLLTYNMSSGVGADDAFDLRRTARAIVATDADIVALQEVNRGNILNGFADDVVALIEYLRPAGYRYWAFGPAANLLYGNAIFSRYPLVASQNTLYAAAQGEQRAILAARVRVGGRRVAVYATHLTSGAALSAERQSQVEELLALAAGESLPRAILGDMDAGPETTEIGALRAAYADGYTAGGGTLPGYTFPAGQPDRRIDYIFVGDGLRPLEGQVVAGEMASDHLPLVVKVAIER